MRLVSLLLILASLLFLRATLFGSSGTAQAGTAVRMDVAALVRGSDLILEGRVSSAVAREDERGRIETEYVLSVERTHLGEPLAARGFRFPGGVLPDGRGLALGGMPSLQPGERVLVFLSPPSVGGMRMPVGLSQGKLRVVESEGGRKLLARDAGQLHLVDANGAAAADERALLDYQAFQAELAAAVAARRRPTTGQPAGPNADQGN